MVSPPVRGTCLNYHPVREVTPDLGAGGPAYHGGMPENYDLDELYANTYTEEDQREFESQPVSEKRFLTAWLLGLLLGLVGADRFYLGRTGSAVAKLLTVGGLGAWMLIDLFLLLSGSLRDRQDRRLDGYTRWAGRCAAVTILAVAMTLVLGLIIGTSTAVTSG